MLKPVLVSLLCAAMTVGCATDERAITHPTIPQAPLAANSPARPFVGTYRLISRADERAQVDSAIDGVVSQMNGLIRGIAREKLTEANVIPETVQVKAGDDLVAISLDQDTSSAPPNGRPVKQLVTTGEMMDVAVSLGSPGPAAPSRAVVPLPTEQQPVVMQETFTGDGKGRVNSFELRGSTLVMHVRIYSTQLPQDLEYDLEFERV